MGLLVALLLGGTAYATHKKAADNRLTKEVINTNIEDAENLIARIDRNMDAALKRCDGALEKLYMSNKAVFQATFPEFVKTASQLMNVEFDDRQDPMRQLAPKKIDCEINTHAKALIDDSDYGTLVEIVKTALTSGVGLLSQTIYSIKLQASLAETKTELTKVQAAVEVAKREIVSA